MIHWLRNIFTGQKGAKPQVSQSTVDKQKV